MASPRYKVISPSVTPYYHCTSKCVRGAFLCGKDSKTNKNFKHRRNWLEKRLLKTASVFAIDVCSFAIMDNHFHVVVKLNPKRNEQWSDQDVLERWHRIFKGTATSKKFCQNQALDKTEQKHIVAMVKACRAKLNDIGWFMRCIKEPIARKANREDQCTGRFWEGRYHCQALLDNKALMLCMAYVDLNPLRARLCKLPEDAKHTSLVQRIRASKSKPVEKAQEIFAPFAENLQGSDTAEHTLPCTLDEYLKLVDWSSRHSKQDRASISVDTPPLLERLNFMACRWTESINQFGQLFSVMAGSCSMIKSACEKMSKAHTWRQRNCEYYFGA